MPRSSSSSSSSSASGSSKSSVRKKTRALPDTVPVNAMVYFCCQNPKKVKGVRAYYYDDDFETGSNRSYDSAWSWASSSSNVSYGFVFGGNYDDDYSEEIPKTMPQPGRPVPGSHPGMMPRPPQHFQQPSFGGGQPPFPQQPSFQHPGQTPAAWGNGGVTVVDDDDDDNDDDDSGSDVSSDDGSAAGYGGHPGGHPGGPFMAGGGGPRPGVGQMPMPMQMPTQGAPGGLRMPAGRIPPQVIPHPHMTGHTQMAAHPRTSAPSGLPRMTPVPPHIGFSPAGRMGPPPPPPGPGAGVQFVQGPNGMRAFQG